jgi:hypothetical protein
VFRLTAGGRRIDRVRKVEAAMRRTLARADRTSVEQGERMLALIVAELLD